MQLHLYPDITTNILTYLTKTDSFNLLNISTNMAPLRKILYGKYLFNHHEIKKNEIIPYIRHLKSKNLVSIGTFCNLNSLKLECNAATMIRSTAHSRDEFNKRIIELPNTIQTLSITCEFFDYPINQLPSELQSLTINSWVFNQQLDNLPKNIKTLIIESYHYDKSLDNLPNTLQSLKIKNPKYANKIIIPESLQTLELGNNVYYYPFEEYLKI